MKNAKKVFAMLIVLALAISMAIPVSAANGTGKITIDNAIKNQSYTLYNIADLNYVSNDDGGLWAYTVVNNPSSNKDWYDFLSSDAVKNYFTLTASADNANLYVITEKGNISAVQAEDIAKAAIAWAKTNSISGETIVASSTTVEFTNKAYGYYVVDTTTGTFCTLDSVNGDITIKEKNTEPSVDKIIDTVNERAINADAADVKIGDIVTYTITITVRKGAQNYKIVDVLSAGLTFVDSQGKDVANGTLSASAITISNNAINSTASFNSTKNEITVTINGEEELTDGSTITLTYKAKVNTKAKIDEANDNTVTLSFGDDATVNTKSDVVNVYPLSFDIQKTDNAGNAISGAEFIIYQLDGNTKKYLTFSGTEKEFLYTSTTEKESEATVVKANTTDKGLYVINGLDAGTYFIHEKTVPTGYNALAEDAKITITATVDVNDEDALTIGYEDGTSTDTISIVNSTGTELPETGATGTIIFITVGGLMVVAMGVLLVVRKRMSKVVYTR